eukprot:TRINITY_DN13477_c0_g1_i3.p1 TRINITY_DN13477_c0_g1~~TRINITY_DN13477_c0_g1_i3.p1  ORF type:complete len:135 (+),score=29.67 TRINITY_DN13477_c0_g1_i3:291-695(+)
MHSSSESFWRRQKQEKERHLKLQLSAKKSLEKQSPTASSGNSAGGLLCSLYVGQLPEELYDPVSSYIDPGDDVQMEDISPTIAHFEHLKRVDEKATAGAPSEVLDWVSRTLATAPGRPVTAPGRPPGQVMGFAR